MTGSPRISYLEAIKNPARRQEYLDDLDLGPFRNQIAAVFYHHRCDEYASLLVRHFGATVYLIVGRKLFSEEFNEHDVISALRDHEGSHYRDIFCPPAFLTIPCCEWLWPAREKCNSMRRLEIVEIRAYNNQLRVARAMNMELSPRCRELIQQKKDQHVAALRRARKERRGMASSL